MTHDEIIELLGVFALDASSPEETRLVEEHLVSCPRCRAEVGAHREVAAMLGNLGGEAPPAVWERIAGELETERGVVPSSAPVVPIVEGAGERERRGEPRELESDARRRYRRRRPTLAVGLGALAAALALVVGLLSAKVGDLDNQVARIQVSLATTNIERLALAAATDPSSSDVRLVAPTGSRVVSATLVVAGEGQAYLVAQRLRPLRADQTYQLWAQVPGRIVSIGVLGPSPRYVAVRVEANMTTFMVTAEPEGGSLRPTTAVIAAGSLRPA